MPQTKEQKLQVVSAIKEDIASQKAIIFADFTGLATEALLALKKSLKEGQSAFRVAKKTLLKVAFEESKLTEVGDKIKGLTGQVAVIFGFQDEVAPAKAISQFAKTNEQLKVLGGYLNGAFVDTAVITQLSQLPSMLELRGKFVATIAAPMTGFLQVLQGSITQLVYALSAIQSKKGQN